MPHDDWYTNSENDSLETDSEMELADIPAEDLRSEDTMLLHLGMAALQRIRQFKGMLTPIAEDNDRENEHEFDLHITDIPLNDLTTPQRAHLLPKIITQGRRPRAIFLSALLFIMFVVLVDTVTPVHDRIVALLPLAVPTSHTEQNPSSHYPGHLSPTNAVVEENRTQVLQMTIDGKEKYLFVPAKVPYECPTGVTPGHERQVGNFPVWLSGFGTPNTILHLQPTFVSSPRDWPGWVVSFHVNVKLRYSSLIILTIDDLDHASSPLLLNPINGTHEPRIVLNPTRTQHILGPNGHREIGWWDMSIYLPGAGCYILNASWEEGNWEMIFAAGK